MSVNAPSVLPSEAPPPLADRERLRFWLTRLQQFGTWQLLSQALQLVNGLLLVRWLSLDAYARYGVALSFQNMLNVLVDLGFSGSIIALVGDRINDRELVGHYVHAARSYRNRMLATVGPLSAAAFLWLAYSHGWSLLESLLLFSSILAFLFFQGWTACYTPPLLMQLQITRLYRPGVILMAAKLLASAILFLSNLLGAAVVSWLNAIAAMVTGFIYRREAQPFYTETLQSDRTAGREIRRYVSPLIPGMIFFAFQSQIQIFLISLFGESRSIAEVSALARLGQLFIFLSSFHITIVAPYIARAPLSRLGLRYLQAVLFTVVIATLLCLSAYLFPAPFLWLLGPKYHGLRLELTLSLSASSLAFIAGTIYTLNNARKWVYHWTGLVNVGGLIAIQILVAGIANLATTVNVLRLSVASAGYSVLVFAITAVYGYRATLRQVASR